MKIEKYFCERKAVILAPVPGYDYSGLDFQGIIDAWNR